MAARLLLAAPEVHFVSLGGGPALDVAAVAFACAFVGSGRGSGGGSAGAAVHASVLDFEGG